MLLPVTNVMGEENLSQFNDTVKCQAVWQPKPVKLGTTYLYANSETLDTVSYGVTFIKDSGKRRLGIYDSSFKNYYTLKKEKRTGYSTKIETSEHLIQSKHYTFEHYHLKFFPHRRLINKVHIKYLQQTKHLKKGEEVDINATQIKINRNKSEGVRRKTKYALRFKVKMLGCKNSNYGNNKQVLRVYEVLTFRREGRKNDGRYSLEYSQKIELFESDGLVFRSTRFDPNGRRLSSAQLIDEIHK